MSVAVVAQVLRMPFGAREAYGSPYPSGLAAAHAAPVGDATGGIVTVTVTSVASFIYRLELITVARVPGSGGTSLQVQPISRILQQRSGFGNASFSPFFAMTARIVGSNGMYEFPGTEWERMRRLPLGSLEAPPLQINVMQTIDPVNTDGTDYFYNFLFSYWAKESFYRPGFLSSFYETPIIPSPIPVG